MKAELISGRKILHLRLLWKINWRELRNGRLRSIYNIWNHSYWAAENKNWQIKVDHFEPLKIYTSDLNSNEYNNLNLVICKLLTKGPLFHIKFFLTGLEHYPAKQSFNNEGNVRAIGRNSWELTTLADSPICFKCLPWPWN